MIVGHIECCGGRGGIWGLWGKKKGGGLRKPSRTGDTKLETEEGGPWGCGVACEESRGRLRTGGSRAQCAGPGGRPKAFRF